MMNLMEKVNRAFSTDLDMSLIYFFGHNFDNHPTYYNCSTRTLDEWYALGQPRPFLGAYFLISGLILVAIYIPCIIVIARSDLMRSTCYKIMLWLSFLDLCCLSTNSISTGYLGLKGAVYCTHPRFIFFMGALGCGCWMGSCSTCILLAINRCCDINDSLWIRKIFVGKRIYITLSVPFIYSIYSVFFCKPILFNSNYMTWFFNPMTDTSSEFEYVSVAHTINNLVVSMCTTSLYTYLCILLITKNRHVDSVNISRTQKQIFFQSILICSFNALAAYIYVYMQFFSSPNFLILLGSLAWQCSHGSVGVVYITMNKTVRRGVVKLLVPRFLREKMRVGSFMTTTMRTNNPVSRFEQTSKQQAGTTGSSGAVF